MKNLNFKVENFYNKNQFIISDGENTIFQSYQSICAIRDWDKKEITLGRDWDYSKTTLKHLKAFLDITLTTKEIRKAIEIGQLGGFKLTYNEDLI